jgi:hypothetical protein
MRRRDISKVILASAVGPTLAPRLSSAQVGNQPGYPRTQTEINAGTFPKNLAYPQGDARRYGAIGDGITDDTAAIQEAVNFCVKARTGLLVDGRFLLTSSVNIDRREGSASDANYFMLSSTTGGGFLIRTNIAMFSSSIAFTNAPVSALTYFDGVYFESSEPGQGYVLNDGRFLRIRFHGCSFFRILACNCKIRYTQSVQFTNCNIRFGKGVFWTSGAGGGFSTDDFKFLNNIVEAWNGDVLNLGIPIGCSVSNNLMEGISGTAIVTEGAQGLLVSGNYFEANGIDLDTTSGGRPCNGLAFIGNRTHPKDLKTHSVLWSSIGEGCVSIGNYSGGGLHRLPVNASIYINDSAAGLLWNTPPLNNRNAASWSPVDSSGAGLIFANASGSYSILGDTKLIEFEFEITFPETANLAAANIGGLPFASTASGSSTPISGGTTYTNHTSYIQVAGGRSSTTFNLYNLSIAITNASLSRKIIRMFGRYLANI